MAGRTVFKGAIIAATSLLMASCAQDSSVVRINVGIGLISSTEPDQATDYAALYLPYAQMARLAYVPPEVLGGNGCPDIDKLNPRRIVLNHESTRGSDRLQWARHVQELNTRFYRWRCAAGWHGEIPAEFFPQTTTKPAPGLAFYVWVRAVGNSCTIAIAYRGTDTHDSYDWRANLRWLTWFLPLGDDQYDHVQESVKYAVHRGRVECNGARQLWVHMVGHSLGGGLAQAASYAHRDSDYVFAFDSSPITAFSGVSADDALSAQKGLAIDRVYETGEILQGVRYLVQGFFNPRSCNPRVRRVRFNQLSGSFFSQHSIEALTEKFREMTQPASDNNPNGKGWRGNPTRAYGGNLARDCNYINDPVRDPPPS